MNKICVKTENLSKSFTVLERKNTTLQVLKSLLKHEPLKQTLWVLRNLSCEIKKGEKTALLGRNGCGKTTFLRLLTGIYNETSGNVIIHGIPRVLFKSSFGLNGRITVLDNIYLLGAIHGIKRSVLDNKIEEILTNAGLNDVRHALLKKLSSGQTQRLALSVFFQADGDLLIFDEALESVDLGFVQKCDDYFQRLSHSDKTIILASHHGSFLKKYCTRALWIENGTVQMHGSFDEVYPAYERSFIKP